MRTTYDPIKTSERLNILKLQLAAKFKQNSPTYIHKALHERTMPTQFGEKTHGSGGICDQQNCNRMSN